VSRDQGQAEALQLEDGPDLLAKRQARALAAEL
jgi:hypothetical protein